MRLWAILCFLLAAAGPCFAQNCTGLTATAVSFGNYTSGTTSSPAGAALSVTCPSGTTIIVTLNQGTGSGAIEAVRKMTSGSYTLGYRLYQDAAFSKNWGDSTSMGYEQFQANGQQHTLYVYPTLSAGQNVVPGTYTDTITVNVTVNNINPVTTTFPVTAVVQKTCTVSAAPLSFGRYATARVSATSAITLTCTLTTAFSLALGVGTGSGATVTNRLMTKGASTLLYSLWRDAIFQTPWGNTTGTSAAGTGTGAMQNLTVFGEILAGHFVSPGAYADTIAATITY